jgi:hypothetical protein
MRRVYGFVEDGQIKAIGDDLDEVVSVARQGGGEVLVMDGNPLRENPESRAVPKTVAGALKIAKLKPVTKKEVFALTVEDAHRILLKKGIKGATPGAMARGFIKANAKLSKELTDPDVIKALKKSAPSVLATRKQALAKLNKAGFADGICRGVVLLPYAFANQVAETTGRKKLPMIGNGLCAGSSQACRDSCLAFAGQNTVTNAETGDSNLIPKFRYVEALYDEPAAFVRMMIASIEAHVRSCKKKGTKPFVRLNVLSDIPWEAYLAEPGEESWFFEYFQTNHAELMFYDYTKVGGRTPPDNYDLTLSYSGGNDQQCKAHLEKGGRVAMVFVHAFRTKRSPERTPENAGTVDPLSKTPADRSLARSLPEKVWGAPVIDGDGTDIRPLDPRGKGIIGLRWKVFQGSNLTFDDNGEPKTNTTVLQRSIKGKFVYPWYLDEESGWVMAPELPGCHTAGDE